MESNLDLRIQKTYLSLHNAFSALLEEKKFEDFTVNELCNRAMIRRATFYKHFADKYEYFTFYMKEIVADFQNRLAPDVSSDEVGAYLMHMSLELLHFIREHAQMVHNVRTSSMFPTLLVILLEQISTDITQVLRRAHHADQRNQKEIEGTAAFYSGGLLCTLFQMLDEHDAIDEERFVNIISKFLVSYQIPNR